MDDLSVGLLCLLFVVVSILISVAGLIIVRKRFPEAILKGDEVEAAGVLYSIVGTIYAVVLAFIMVMVWQRYQEEQQRTVLEACELGNLYHDLRGLPGEQQKKAQALVRQYTHDLVEDAWPMMIEGRESRKALQSFNDLYGEVIHFAPSGDGEAVIYDRLISHMNQLASYRQLRLLSSLKKSVHPILWAILLGTGLITMVFSYFFHIGTVKVQVLMTAIAGCMSGLILFLVLLFNHPYRSSIRVSPFPFEKLLNDVFPEADRTEK